MLEEGSGAAPLYLQMLSPSTSLKLKPLLLCRAWGKSL